MTNTILNHDKAHTVDLYQTILHSLSNLQQSYFHLDLHRALKN